MKKGITFLIMLLIAASFTSCEKKEDDKVEEEAGNEEIIQSHIWKGVEAKTFTNGTETNTLSITDYEFSFDANKDFSVTKNGNVEFSGTWEFIKGDPEIIKTTETNTIKEYNVDKVNDNELEISIETSAQTTYKYFLIK